MKANVTAATSGTSVEKGGDGQRTPPEYKQDTVIPLSNLNIAFFSGYHWTDNTSSLCSTVPCRLCSGAGVLVIGSTCGIIHASTPWLLTVRGRLWWIGGGLLVVLVGQMCCWAYCRSVVMVWVWSWEV